MIKAIQYFHNYVEVETQGGWVGRISAEIGKTMEVSKNGIWWYSDVTTLRVAIPPERHLRNSIGYGYDLFHNK